MRLECKEGDFSSFGKEKALKAHGVFFITFTCTLEASKLRKQTANHWFCIRSAKSNSLFKFQPTTFSVLLSSIFRKTIASFLSLSLSSLSNVLQHRQILYPTNKHNEHYEKDPKSLAPVSIWGTDFQGEIEKLSYTTEGKHKLPEENERAVI